MKRTTLCFIIMAVLWEIAVGLIFGFSLRYNEQNFISMSLSNSYYPYSATTTSNSLFQVNSTMFPFPMVVVAVAFILLIVGNYVIIKDMPSLLPMYPKQPLLALHLLC